jgi:hypothetical protein
MDPMTREDVVGAARNRSVAAAKLPSRVPEHTSDATRARKRAWWPALAVGVLLAWVNCSPPSSPHRATRAGVPALPVAKHRLAKTLVLIALDGVRWRDVFEGVERERALVQGMPESRIVDGATLLPHLHALMAEGAALGAPSEVHGIEASGPNFVSLPGYEEMLSGRRPTGCLGNGCGRVTWATLADQFSAVPGVTPLEVGVIASWSGIGRAASCAPEGITLSVGRTQGVSRDRLRYDARASELLDAGAEDGPWPGHGDFRRDRATAAIALRYLERVHPRFLFLGLGETDEFGHRNDYPRYVDALVFADHVIGEVAGVLASFRRAGGRATLFVTTDHGRSRHFINHGAFAPESALTWLVAAGSGIRARGNYSPDRERHTASIAMTLRVLGGLDPGSGNAEPLWGMLQRAPRAQASLAASNAL